MITPRIVHCLVACSLAVTPVSAAVTTRGVTLDENPRTIWQRSQDSRQGTEQVERFSQVFTITGDGALDLHNISGDIRVSVGRSNNIQVEAVKRVRHRDSEEARRVLQALRIETTHIGGRVQVRTVFPRTTSRGVSVAVDYTIAVPASAAVAVKAISGDISINGVRGEVRADAISGNVSITGTPNVALAKTVSGNVIARDIGGPTTLQLGTISGTVIASGLKIRALEAGTISGSIQLSDLTVERLQAKAMTGDIEYNGSLSRGGHYDLNSHSGNVRVLLVGAPGFELDASTFNGSIRSDFPITLRSPDVTDPRARRGPNRAIRGTHGDASAILAVRSFSGTVVITKK